MTIKRRLTVVIAGIGLVTAGYAAAAAQAGRPVNLPASGIKWVPYGPGTPLEIAVLWGDRTKGEYGMLLKMPAGFDAGMHTHTADYHAVSVQGTWVHTNSGQPPVTLPVGSYVMQPGKAVHNDQCQGSTPCVLFVHQHAPGDFIPAPAGSK